MDKRLEQAGSFPPANPDKVAEIARAIVHSPLAGMIAYSDQGDQMGTSSFTAPDGRLIEVERRGADFILSPVHRNGQPVETIHDSLKPKLDSKL